MADRCAASITIGGKIAIEIIPGLLSAISDEGLSTEFDGPKFHPDELISGESLSLHAYEVSWGAFNILEKFCRTHSIPFSRWTGTCAGAWGCTRTVYRGNAHEENNLLDEYDVSDDDSILLGQQLAEHLGSYKAIIDHLNRAEFKVPPLVIEQNHAHKIE